MANKAPETIAEYIKNETPAVQKELKKLYAIVKKAAPRSTEKLAWGMPTLSQEGMLVHFAAFTKHLSLFPGSEAIVKFKKELSKYTTSKGTIQFPYGERIPTTLVTKIVKYNLKSNMADVKAKQRKKIVKK